MNLLVEVRLVTIVAESVLAASIVAALRELGVSGYTLTEARGQGSRGRRTGEIPGDNVHIEVLASAATAERILATVSERWFADYAVVAWVTTASVVRGSKFP